MLEPAEGIIQAENFSSNTTCTCTCPFEKNKENLMIFKKHTCTAVLPVFYQVYYNISQISNRNPQAGGGSLTFEICMGGALAVVGKNPGKRGYGSKYHATCIWRVYE